jgi:hypothetical protein
LKEEEEDEETAQAEVPVVTRHQGFGGFPGHSVLKQINKHLYDL